MFRKTAHTLICLLIAAEFILSGLGYCGHTHSHAHPGSSSATAYINQGEDWCEHRHSHESGVSSKDGDEKSEGCSKSHCFCLGQVSADTIQLHYTIFEQIHLFHPLPADDYDFIYLPGIFHPPTGV